MDLERALFYYQRKTGFDARICMWKDGSILSALNLTGRCGTFLAVATVKELDSIWKEK